MTWADEDGQTEASGAGGRGGTDAVDDPRGQRIHRLRDLSREGRLVAVLLAVLLLVPPVVAFFQFLPQWYPAGDPALMGVRALDVGTGDTPFMGQPSSSGVYGAEVQVRHLGPVHFYLMAPFVRAFGPSAGMLTVSVIVVAGAALISVWVVFRRLGPAAAVLASVSLAAIMFAVGAAGLVNPVSSNFARMPLLCAAVLVWGLLSGDDRLLPLAAVVVSFAVQQHLSVGPTVVVLVLVAVVAVSVRWWRAGLRHDPVVRRRARNLTLLSAGFALVLWSPVLAQEVAGRRGNLGALWEYVHEGGGEQLGLSMASRQIGNVLGFPPMLVDTQLHGADLLALPAGTEWLAAATLLAVLLAVGYRWLRAGDRRGHLVVMVLVLLAAGMLTGSTIPEGPEMARLVFYHWIWPAQLFVLLALAFVVADLARWAARRVDWRPTLPRPLPTPGRRLAAGGALGVAALVMVVLPGINPSLDRPTNTIDRMKARYPREVYESVTGQVLEHRDELPPGPVLLASVGESLFNGSSAAVQLGLADAGVDVLRSPNLMGFVADGRLAWHADEIEGILLLSIPRAGQAAPELPGSLVARDDLWEGFDLGAYRALREELERAGDVRTSDEFERYLASLGEVEGAYRRSWIESLVEDPGSGLVYPPTLETLQDYPLEHPRLDPELVDRMVESVQTQASVDREGGELAMEVYLVTRPEEVATVLSWPGTGVD